MNIKITKRTIKCIAVIVGVIILPLLYSYFYLGAFWDPYSRLETLPVAVVNEDSGSVINGKSRNIGEELCDKLKEDSKLKFVFTNENDARTGTENKEYYAMIIIPSDFSADIASSTSSQKQIATITYSPNEKRNYLASQILSKALLTLEESAREGINKEITQALVDQLESVPDKLTELNDGLGQLSDGANTLAAGTETYYDKYKTFHSKINELNKGISSLVTGANQITDSTTNITSLTSGAQTLAQGAKEFNENLIQYTAGVDALISNVNSTSQFLTNYVTKINPGIMQEPYFAGFMAQLSKNANENRQRIETLSAANAKLKEASGQIADGAQQLSDGTANLPQLQAALAQLSQGLQQVQDGSNQLSSASNQLASASSDIANGASQITEGLSQAKTEVSKSTSDADSQIGGLNGLADFASAPVKVETQNVTSVPNYGTAFAPYFLSLSLWVGGLMIFVGIYYDPDNKFKVLSRESENKVARSFIYLLIGFTQAIVLGIVLMAALGLKVDNIPLYFLSCCLVSVVFISIIQFLMVYLKDLGKFLSMLLLILQLTSCGGTFPMETVPKFFNMLYKYMPMTYSVGLFKQSISGVKVSELMINIVVLSAILIVFMTLTVIFSTVRTKKEEKIIAQEAYIN